MADTRCLVIANETVGGDDLEEEVRRRSEGGTASFHVVVPGGEEAEPRVFVDPGTSGDDRGQAMVGGGTAQQAGDREAPDGETTSGTTGTPRGGPASDRGGELSAPNRARVILEHVLDRLERVAEDVTGEVVMAGPVEAARDAVASRNYDEVVLATPKAGASKIVGKDLPSRVEEAIDVPLTRVFAERSDPRAAE